VSGPRRTAQKEAQPNQPPPPEGLFFVQQHNGIGNACGTIACVHAVANGAASGAFALSDGPLKAFMDKTAALSVADRGRALAGYAELQEMSDATAASGETDGAGTDDAQGQHFIAFVRVGEVLYELDGRNFDHEAGDEARPFCHGGTSEATFLADAAKIIKEDVMSRDPESINFNITALCKLD